MDVLFPEVWCNIIWTIMLFFLRCTYKDYIHHLVRRSLTLAREEGQEYYIYRIRSTAENLQQRKVQLLHHNDGCGLLGPV